MVIVECTCSDAEVLAPTSDIELVDFASMGSMASVSSHSERLSGIRAPTIHFCKASSHHVMSDNDVSRCSWPVHRCSLISKSL